MRRLPILLLLLVLLFSFAVPSGAPPAQAANGRLVVFEDFGSHY